MLQEYFGAQRTWQTSLVKKENKNEYWVQIMP